MRDKQSAEPQGWRARQPLSGTDVTDLLALQRVCGRPDSRVDHVRDRYVENEHPVLPFLADGLAALIKVGHLRLGEPHPTTDAIRPVLVTASGRARYEDLCDRQGIAPYPTIQVISGTPRQ